MRESKVWLITGAGSGIGLEIAKAALEAGHKVVAGGRDVNKVTKAIDDSTDNLLVVQMDVTNPLLGVVFFTTSVCQAFLEGNA